MRALLLVLCACGGASSSTAANNAMRVVGGQYVAHAPPASNGGPSVTQLSTGSTFVRRGEPARASNGSVEKSATSVLISFQDDPGYFVVVTGNADILYPDQLSFQFLAAFSAGLAEGTYAITARGVNAAGAVGEPFETQVQVVDRDPQPSGTLIVALEWDVDADLDLHLQLPGDKEVWARKISSYDPTAIIDPAAVAAGGALDFDSNASCAIDGRRRENISWTARPPSGSYVARVDTFSLCGQGIAYWHVTATLDGQVLAEARGVARPTDTRFSHERGAGLTAIAFDVP